MRKVWPHLWAKLKINHLNRKINDKAEGTTYRLIEWGNYLASHLFYKRTWEMLINVSLFGFKATKKRTAVTDWMLKGCWLARNLKLPKSFKARTTLMNVRNWFNNSIPVFTDRGTVWEQHCCMFFVLWIKLFNCLQCGVSRSGLSGSSSLGCGYCKVGSEQTHAPVSHHISACVWGSSTRAASASTPPVPCSALKSFIWFGTKCFNWQHTSKRIYNEGI